jgi:hypothetical protein
MAHLVSSKFEPALKHAETQAIYDLDSQWCVAIRYGVFGAFPLSYALDHDYAIVCITIY